MTKSANKEEIALLTEIFAGAPDEVFVERMRSTEWRCASCGETFKPGWRKRLSPH